MNKIGVLVESLGANDVAFDFITSVGSVDRETDVVGFWLNASRACIAPKFATLEAYLSYSYDGALIGVGLQCYDRVRQAATSKNRFLYLWSLDHLFTVYSFQDLWSLFNSSKIIVRSTEIAEGMKKVWGLKEVKVARNFKELFKVINE